MLPGVVKSVEGLHICNKALASSASSSGNGLFKLPKLRRYQNLMIIIYIERVISQFQKERAVFQKFLEKVVSKLLLDLKVSSFCGVESAISFIPGMKMLGIHAVLNYMWMHVKVINCSRRFFFAQVKN